MLTWAWRGRAINTAATIAPMVRERIGADTVSLHVHGFRVHVSASVPFAVMRQAERVAARVTNEK
jgi:DNA-binding protein